MTTAATRIFFFLRKMAYEQNNNSASVPFLDVYCIMDYDAKLPGSASFFSQRTLQKNDNFFLFFLNLDGMP